jgi:hypothetical protein
MIKPNATHWDPLNIPIALRNVAATFAVEKKSEKGPGYETSAD